LSDKNLKLLSFIVETNLLYWSEVYGQLSLNNSYDEMMDYLSKYCSYFKDINNVKNLNDESFFKDADSGLYYYFSTTLSDFLNKAKNVKRNCDLYSRINSDSNFSKIVRYTIDGNRYLSKKEYSNAVIYYKAAVSLNEEFYDAKKNLIEAEFQNKLSLSLMKRDKTDAENLVYDKMSEIDDMIRIKDGELSSLPFYYNDKFVSQLYSLKAAMIMVLIDENTPKNKKERLENSIKTSIENSLKYDPQNKMAKEILARLNQK
ncbi:MAG TPA: hypothetical protein PLD81_09960, partial [Elusimicrobiales bacterium]|nr:hypothetical protein [Elusimicrobiales bacterium]